MRTLRDVTLPLVISALACSIAKEVAAKDVCMLQHETLGTRAARQLHEDLEFAPSKQAPLRESKTASKLAPRPDVTPTGPRPGAKTAPRVSGKSPAQDRITTAAPKTFPKSLTSPSTTVTSARVTTSTTTSISTTTTTTTTTTTNTTTTATIPDFGDDETVSKNVALSIKPTLEEINLGPTGPLDKFTLTFENDVANAMEVEPERMIGLRMNDKAENQGSQIDFELTAGRPSAGRSAGNLAAQLADKRSNLMTGSLSKILEGAFMVVTNGTQANHPTINWRETHPPRHNPIIKQIEMALGLPWAMIVLFLAIAAIAMAYFLRSRLN